MTRLKLVAAGVLVASSLTSAYASSLNVGIGAGYVQSPYRSYTNDVWPMPVISYEGDNVWFRGLGGGVYLWNDASDKLSVMGYYSPLSFKPGNSDNHQLRRLDKRDSTVMAGLMYEHFTRIGFLRTAFTGDVLDNSNGFVWDTAWLYRYINGSWVITPGIGVTWNSDNQNEYYYGVSRDEARRSGMNSYDPDSGWNPYMELSVSYRLTSNLSLFGSGRYTRLSDEIKDSPMVSKSWLGLLSAGVTYRF